jgi:predicted nuclease of restriction endonuclease-like (RecB) superfamily
MCNNLLHKYKVRISKKGNDMKNKDNIPQFVNSDSFMADKNYVKWLSDLKKRFHIAQLKAAVKVNTEMLKFYWSLGEDICEKQKQYKWGANFMKRLSLDLRAEFPQAEGFSVVNLYYIKRWFAFYSSHTNFFYQAGKKLQDVENSTIPMPDILLCVPWRHQTVIVSKCENIKTALFYLKKVLVDNMSRTELVHAIETKLYEHTGKALNNFDVTLPQPQNALATEIIKDPYKLDFFLLPSKFSEMDLENKLATNITRFLLELGKGFAYVGRQMELDTPSGKSYFPDMIFYHTRLKCYVVVELKIVDFIPEFIGKLNFYVSAADELLRGEGDNPSIGILLCKDKDSSVVEWSLRGITTPLGMASYQLQEVYERTLLEIKQEASEDE